MHAQSLVLPSPPSRNWPHSAELEGASHEYRKQEHYPRAYL